MTTTMTRKQALELEGFSIKTGNRALLSQVDLCLAPAGLTAIFGRSGCGKTTLLKALCHLAPFGGRVRLGGHDIAGLKPQEVRVRLQYLHQEPCLFAGTVRENLFLPGSFKQNRGRGQAAQAVQGHLAGLGLPTGILDQDALKLSGGEKQRVALVRSLLLEPDFLLLDEPTSAMDVSSEEIALAYLGDRSKEMGVIAVTHSVEFISRADRALLLAEGALREITGDLDRASIRGMVQDG